MKTKWNVALIAGMLAISVCAYGGRARQDKSAQKTEPSAAPQPAPEMECLKPYLGEWDYTESYEKSPAFPNGGKNTGVYTSKLGPGGNSLVNHFHSQGPVGDFEGLIVMTWDPKEKAYKAYTFGNGFPGAIIETGQFERDALVFRTEFSMGGATVKLRNVTHFLDSGKFAAEEYATKPGGPETLALRVDGKKR